jgi:hypothetical protein
MVYLPLVRQPARQLADGNQRQIDQQLRDVALRIDVMAAAGAGQTGKDGRRSFSTLITGEQAVLPIEHNAFHLPLADVMPTAGLCRAVDAGYGPACFVISRTRHKSYGLFMLASVPVKERAHEHNYLGRWGVSEAVRRVSSIIFAPRDTRNVLCARNDGLCLSLAQWAQRKGIAVADFHDRHAAAFLARSSGKAKDFVAVQRRVIRQFQRFLRS